MGMGHVSTGSFQAWRTPPALAAKFVEEYQCVLDAAADKDNAVCPTFYDGEPGSDGLTQPWVAPEAGVWVNPPYEDSGSWLTKACEEVLLAENCARAVLLVPAAIGTAWFSRALRLAEVHLFDERIRFLPPPRDELPPALQDALYKKNRYGEWVPKTSPGGGNALLIVEIGRTVGVTTLRSSRTGEIIQTFAEARRVV